MPLYASPVGRLILSYPLLRFDDADVVRQVVHCGVEWGVRGEPGCMGGRARMHAIRCVSTPRRHAPMSSTISR
jgi:hypothetical protein